MTAATSLFSWLDGLPTLGPPLSLVASAPRSACRGRTELFFAPHAERGEARERRETEARVLCLACSLLEACRAWARESREYGFWGGESEEERVAAGYPPALPVGRVARAARTHCTTPWRRERQLLATPDHPGLLMEGCEPHDG